VAFKINVNFWEEQVVFGGVEKAGA